MLLKDFEGSDKETADKVGVSQATISNYKNGKLPRSNSSKAFLKFCRHFKISANALRNGKIVKVKPTAGKDLHGMLDDLLTSDISDAIDTMIRTFWKTHVRSLPDREPAGDTG